MKKERHKKMREKSKERQRVSTMTTMKANVYDEKSSFASTRARVLFLSSFGYDFSGKKRTTILCGRTFSSSVARSNLRSSRRLLPNSSTISRRSSSPRTGRREALFYFLLSACAYKMYIALFLVIRETSLPLVLVFPFVERTGKEKERKKSSLLFFFFFFFSRVRSCASCYPFFIAGLRAKPSVRRTREAQADVWCRCGFFSLEPPSATSFLLEIGFFCTETLSRI